MLKYNNIDFLYTLYIIENAFVDIDEKLDIKILTKDEYINNINLKIKNIDTNNKNNVAK